MGLMAFHHIDQMIPTTKGKYLWSTRRLLVVALFIACALLLAALLITDPTQAADTTPAAVSNIGITEHAFPIHIDKGTQFLKAGESYQINGTGPTTLADEDLDHITFFMADKSGNQNELALHNFAGDEIEDANKRKNYVLEFVAQEGYGQFYAISYDNSGNSSISEQITGVVDGRVPNKVTNLSFEKKGQKLFEITGTVSDPASEGANSGMSHVLLYIDRGEGPEVVCHEDNGSYEWFGDEEYRTGDPMKVQVEDDNSFTATMVLDVINSENGDVRNVIFARGYDKVGNEGPFNDATEQLTIMVLDPKASMDVKIEEEAFGLSDGVDQLKDMSVIFLQFPAGDVEYHTFEMSYQNQVPDIGDAAFPMVGYWTVETSMASDFLARVRIEFQHPSISAFDFDRLRLLTRSGIGNNWRVLENATFIHQEANPAAGIPEMWYVETTVDKFSDFAIVQAKPDFVIADLAFSHDQARNGETISVTVTIENRSPEDIPTLYAPSTVLVRAVDRHTNKTIFSGDVDFPEERDEQVQRVVFNYQTEYWYYRENYSQEPEFLIKVMVDPDQAWSERQEDNNQREVSIPKVDYCGHYHPNWESQEEKNAATLVVVAWLMIIVSVLVLVVAVALFLHLGWRIKKGQGPRMGDAMESCEIPERPVEKEISYDAVRLFFDRKGRIITQLEKRKKRRIQALVTLALILLFSNFMLFSWAYSRTYNEYGGSKTPEHELECSYREDGFFVVEITNAQANCSAYDAISYLLSGDGNPLPEMSGSVDHIYGLNISYAPHNFSFQDNDKNSQLSPGDCFLIRSSENGGPAEPGQIFVVELRFGGTMGEVKLEK